MLYPRQVLAKIKPFLKQPLIILLAGSRQVGKTSILRLIQAELKKQHLATDKQIVYFDLESFEDLELLQSKPYRQFADYLYTRTGLPSKTELYVFIDEIQYLERPSPFFKLLADHYPKIHLILSGSSSLEIKKIFTERLTGRKVLFQVRPLSFAEYLIFQEHPLAHLLQNLDQPKLIEGSFNQTDKLKDFMGELLPIYEDFVAFGSYPRPSLKESKPIRETLLKEIRDTYVRKDISDILRVENLSGFNKLLQLLAGQIGNLVNLQELSNSSRLNRETVERYLFLMQETYILSLVTPFYTNPRQEIIKMPKVYLADTGIRNILLDSFQPLKQRIDKGALAENAVFNQLEYLELPIKFWRTKTKVETDFVIQGQNGDLVPLEVKYQPFRKPLIPSGLASYIERYQPQQAFVVSRDYFDQTSKGKTTVHFVPALCW